MRRIVRTSRSSSPRPESDDGGVGLRAPLLAGAAAVVGSWALLSYLPVFHSWLIGDVRFYENWGTWLATHELPYRDFGLEYPPGSLPAFLAPVYLRKLAGYTGTYYEWFRVEVLVLDLATLLVVAWALRSLRASRTHAFAAFVFFGLASLALGPIAISRYDAWPALVTALGVAALLAGRERLACAAFGLGVVVKIFPIVLLPLAVVALWRRRGRRAALEGAGIGVLVAVVGFGPFAALAPHGLWHGMWRQASRPLQIESLAASFWVVAHQVGGLHLQAVESYGSDNLVTPGTNLASTLSGLAVLVAIAAVWIWFARSPGGPDEVAVASAACVVAYVALNKVFSPQYLVWLFPLVPLVRGRRGVAAAATLAAATLLTQAWEPYRYAHLFRHWDAVDSTLLVVRDLLVLALLPVLLWSRPLRGHAEQLDAPSAAVG